ncbi:MAG: hypothetical protein HKN50_09005 [Gammaproteobacteria bacterium]|nr:hypothetical protein [Gammaproteobacteria bacterium]
MLVLSRVIGTGILIVLLGFNLAAHAADAGVPPVNPYLADSFYPVAHGGSHQQDSLRVAGPEGTTRALRADEIQYVHTGPGFFGASTSSPYVDGRRVIWGNGLDRIVKIDYQTYAIVATQMLEGVPHYDEAHAQEAIDYFDENNDGLLAQIKAFKEAQKLRTLASVYTVLDHTNTYFIANKNGYIEAFGDTIAGDPHSGIELKRRFDFPESLTGFGMGINMTYDGWLVLVTEHGYLLALKPDFSEYRISRLQHAEGAEHKATRSPGYGWVRNAPAIGKDGGVYVASQEYMHKVVWDGDQFRTAESDGAWAVHYDNTWGHGTGATPSLMGFGPEADRLVVITDGNPRMNLVLYWRDEIPADWQGLPGQHRRVAGVLAVTMGEQNLSEIQSEQSVVVEGYGALVVNNMPRNIPWYFPERASGLLLSFLGSNPKHQPYGVQKFVWQAQTNELQNAWVNNGVSSPSTVPIVSQLNNKVYLVGARDNQWTLESMDWHSGEAQFHYLIGGQRYNPLYSGTLLDEDGRVHYGTPWGRVRLDPKT